MPKTEVFSMSTGERRLLFDEQGAWVLTGDALVAWTAETMLAYPFDPDRAEVTGGAVPISRSVCRWSTPRPTSTAPHFPMTAAS